MAKRSETLELIIRAKESASKEFKKIDKALGGVRGRMNELKGAVFNLRTAFIGLGAAYAAFRTGKSLIDAASQQKMAVAGLETALKSMGRYTPELSAQLQGLAASLQDVTNFGDEATIEGQKFLATYKKITNDLLPEATELMQDLAALMGGDLVRAANSLGKASMGLTSELTRIGITVNRQTYELEGCAGMFREIKTQVGGQARAMRKATGPWLAMGKVIGDTKEQLGELINLRFSPTIDRWIDSIKRLTEALKGSVEEAKLRSLAEKAWEEQIAKKPESAFVTWVKKQAAALWEARNKVRKATDKLLYDKEAFIQRWIEMHKRLMEPARAVPLMPEIAAPEASADAKAKANLARLKAWTQTKLAEMEKLYDVGEKTLAEYFDRRKVLMERQFAEEIRLLKEQAEAEPDPDKRLAVLAEVYAKEEEWKRKQIELTQQQTEAEEALAQKKVDIANILADLRGRTATGVGDGLQAEFDRELAELDRRHQEEIERLRELNATKEEIDEAYRSQKLEKDKLLADQERRTFETTLESIRGIAGDMESFFADLYAASGEENKKFFQLQKAAAIAETIISTFSAAQKAYDSMAKINPVLATAAAAAAIAAGMARVAKIRAQAMAAGGQVPGFSPSDTADNILIRATAKEFIHPVKTVKHYGLQAMEAIKRRLVPKELFAGFNIPVPSLHSPSYALASGGSVPGRAASSYSINVPITVQGVEDGERVARRLQIEMERTAIRVMRDETR